MKAVVVLALAACTSAEPIEVVQAPEVVVTTLPSTLTCGTTAPERSALYVGNHTTLETACQGDGTTTVLLLDLDNAHRDMAELAAHYRVIAPDLRGYDLERGPVDAYVQDLVMLIRKTSNQPVIVVGDDNLVTLLADRHPELIARPEASDRVRTRYGTRARATWQNHSRSDHGGGYSGSHCARTSTNKPRALAESKRSI